MRCTLLLPGSLLPDAVAAAVITALRAPQLLARLQRARLVADQAVDESAIGAAHLRWLSEQLAGQPHIATAPYALFDLEGTAPPSQVWRADPVHLSAARDHVILVPLDGHALSEHEADALLAAARDVCSAYRCRLFRSGPAWFLEPEQPWTIETAPLESVAYRALLPELPVAQPHDADARRWLRLQNELQMLWHGHAINAVREDRGEPIANSVWLHGGGVWRPLASTRFASVAAPDPPTRGMARAAGARLVDAQTAAADGGLTIWPEAFAPFQRQAWDEWLAAMNTIDTRLSAFPADAELDIVLAGANRVRSFAAAPADRWRFWRRAGGVALLAEPSAA